jgi:hypothetical protein
MRRWRRNRIAPVPPPGIPGGAAKLPPSTVAPVPPSLEELLQRVHKIRARAQAEPELGLTQVSERDVMEALHASEGHVGAAVRWLQKERGSAQAAKLLEQAIDRDVQRLAMVSQNG